MFFIDLKTSDYFWTSVNIDLNFNVVSCEKNTDETTAQPFVYQLVDWTMKKKTSQAVKKSIFAGREKICWVLCFSQPTAPDKFNNSNCNFYCNFRNHMHRYMYIPILSRAI